MRSVSSILARSRPRIVVDGSGGWILPSISEGVQVLILFSGADHLWRGSEPTIDKPCQ